MKDSFGVEVSAGYVVEVSGAWSKSDNGFWLVESCGDSSCYLHRLNSDMSKSTRKLGVTVSWPLKCWSNRRSLRYQADLHNRENAKICVLAPWVEPPKKEVSNEVRILKNGIRKGDVYCPCWYSKRSDGSILITSKHYNTHIPREIGDVSNNSDSMSDYFETDSCRITPDNPYYAVILRKVFGE